MRKDGSLIGFVPTMGYLHEGHLSLVRKSNDLCDKTIVSIFVNPTQFGPAEDLDKYPRDIRRDRKLLEDNGVDLLFFPLAEEIYPQNFQTYINVENITTKLEGEFRPAHFRGVTTIVNILFNCVNPHFAFFGQKDAQQAAVIKQMVNDLKLPVEIVTCPIIREKDGLALSSRNIYLSKSERTDALVLSKTLSFGKSKIWSGERKTAAILSELIPLIDDVESAELDYIKIVEAESFQSTEYLESGKNYYILIACKIGNTRLIDNELISVK